jgi:hypothetical protein
MIFKIAVENYKINNKVSVFFLCVSSFPGRQKLETVSLLLYRPWCVLYITECSDRIPTVSSLYTYPLLKHLLLLQNVPSPPPYLILKQS